MCFILRMSFDLKYLVEVRKSLVVLPKWQVRDSKFFTLVSALDVDGVTVEGLGIRAAALQTMPDRGVMFQLEHAPPHGPSVQLVRIEWNPLRPHTNPNVGPVNLRLQRIDGSHIHGFTDNWIEGENRMRSGNLPIAFLIEKNPESFQQLLKVIGEVLNIDGIVDIEQPPWKEGELF
jgi:hypothetical protein